MRKLSLRWGRWEVAGRGGGEKERKKKEVMLRRSYEKK